MQVRWHGHAFFSIVAANGKRVLIDPFVENGRTRRRVADFSPDIILVSHAHDDHVGSALEWGRPVVANYEMSKVLERRAAGRSEVVGMGVGGFYRRDGLRIWCAPAVHTSGFDDDEERGGAPTYGGVACGFVVDDGETRFYHAGDTAIFGDMRTVIRDLLQPHVAAVPIGDHYTMGVEHAARAIEWLGVNVAVPMHYDTFPAIRADPKEFERRVGAAARVIVPAVDGGFEMKAGRFVRMLGPDES